MSESQCLGLMANLAEAADIKNDLGCTDEESFILQGYVADLRDQSYRDASEAIESNVIYVNFHRREK